MVRRAFSPMMFSRPGIHWEVIETRAPCPAIGFSDCSTMGAGELVELVEHHLDRLGWL